jgi:hypothetical protein
MPRFRKKPIEIEALQLTWENWQAMCDFAGVGPDRYLQPRGVYVDADGLPHEQAQDHADRLGMIIPTLEGEMLASEGDWVIRGIKGELYPCRSDIFDATYEPVEAEVRT